MTEAGLSDFHKLILTFFKTQITGLKPKIVFYRNYKHFEDSRVLKDRKKNDPNENYNFITEEFVDVVYRHALLKNQTLRGNQAPYTTKELRKEIYTRSKVKNKFKRNLTEENKAIYKKCRCFSVSFAKFLRPLFL